VHAELRIAEVARRTGFSAATLRYYEEIGLLPPAARTAGGYRVYDGRTVERLSFLARAKQLGCTLEEIADLTTVWEGGECGPLQDRLQALLHEKVADAQVQVLDLVRLTDELQQAAAALQRHRPNGPCDDRCGCTGTEPGPSSVSLSTETAATEPLGPKPAATSEPAPITCTLPADSMIERMNDWRQLLGFVTGRSTTTAGVRLDLAPDTPVDEVVRLALAEQQCCAFLSFSLTLDDRGVGLEVGAPADAQPVVRTLFGAPA
jgi:MerR family copper efflux transcriptional regulator